MSHDIRYINIFDRDYVKMVLIFMTQYYFHYQTLKLHFYDENDSSEKRPGVHYKIKINILTGNGNDSPETPIHIILLPLTKLFRQQQQKKKKVFVCLTLTTI